MEQNKDQIGEIPVHEQGSFYEVAKIRGLTDFGITVSGKYWDDSLQALREEYDASLTGEEDQSGAAVRGEAVAIDIDDLHGLTRYEYMGRVPMEASGGKWLKASDVFRLFERRAVSARAADALSEPSEPPRLDTEESREYLVTFMERHFTDTTFHRYIRGQIGGSGPLAGDFAWQMARALRRIEAGVVKSRAADALDSQPTDDRCAACGLHCKTGACIYGQPTDGGVRNDQLMRFYAVDSMQALIDAQEQHISKLQAKLPSDTQPAFTRVREG